mgnify:CR=1 FL=1
MKVIVNIPEDMLQELKDGCFGAKHTMYDLAGAICDGVVNVTTNGDMIKAMFPQAIFTDSMVEGYVCNIECHLIGRDTKTMYFDTDWWNAPYEGRTT